MEKAVDSLLETILGGIAPFLNLSYGVLLVLVGAWILISVRRQGSKAKIIASWVCVGIGALGIVAATAQLIL